jgi:hypothetical protein
VPRVQYLLGRVTPSGVAAAPVLLGEDTVWAGEGVWAFSLQAARAAIGRARTNVCRTMARRMTRGRRDSFVAQA